MEERGKLAARPGPSSNVNLFRFYVSCLFMYKMVDNCLFLGGGNYIRILVHRRGTAFPSNTDITHDRASPVQGCFQTKPVVLGRGNYVGRVSLFARPKSQRSKSVKFNPSDPFSESQNYMEISGLTCHPSLQWPLCCGSEPLNFAMRRSRGEVFPALSIRQASPVKQPRPGAVGFPLLLQSISVMRPT